MTDFTTIKKIGYTQAIKSITVGLVIAYCIMSLFGGGLLWILQFDYAPTILFATIMTYVAVYFIGGYTGIWILRDNRSPVVFGIIGGFLIVWTATFMGSLVGLVKEGLPNQSKISDSIHDYLYKPMALVTMFGFLPIILVGIWFGLSIKKKGQKLLNG